MVDETLYGGGSNASVCPWCSAVYDGNPENCPSCDATLTGDAPTDPLPGLTAIDAAAIVRAKEPVARQRSRLLSWISGEYPDDAANPADAGALAPPDAAVRREMLRLELEAEVANLQAEAEAMKAEAVAEGRAPEATPEDAAAAAEVVEDIEAVESGLDGVQAGLEAAPVVEAPPVEVAAAGEGGAGAGAEATESPEDAESAEDAQPA
jgi:hypothetical protein